MKQKKQGTQQTSNRRGILAFVLHEGGSWTDTGIEAPSGVVLKAIGMIRGRRNLISTEFGPASTKMDHIMIVQATPAAAKRLRKLVAGGTIAKEGMDVIRLDPRSKFKGISGVDFMTAFESAARGVNMLKHVAPITPITSTAEETAAPPPVAEEPARAAAG